MNISEQVLLGWLVFMSVLTFLLFGYDKFQAERNGSRVAEFYLALAGAIGGWLGGLTAMLVFRHKTATLGFMVKYSAAFVVWAGLLFAWYAAR